jgi:nucleoside phosphorylase
MGARAAADLARAVAGRDRPSLLLSTGFCGGLDSQLPLGALVVADEIRSGDETVPVNRALVDRARAALDAKGLSPRVGTVECTDDVLGRAQKRELAARGGLSVDLESDPLARWARASGVPFLSCRVVLDTAGEEFPFSTGVPLWISVLRHPAIATRAGRTAGIAAARIGAAVGCLLDSWEERR